MKKQKQPEIYMSAQEESQAFVEIIVAGLIVITMSFIGLAIMSWLIISLLGL